MVHKQQFNYIKNACLNQQFNAYLLSKNITETDLISVCRSYVLITENHLTRALVGFSDYSNKNRVFENIYFQNKIIKNSSRCRFSALNYSVLELNKSQKFIVCSGFADGVSIALAFPDTAVLCVAGESQILTLAEQLSVQFNIDKKNILCIADNDSAGQYAIDQCINAGFSVSRTIGVYNDSSDLFVKSGAAVLRSHLIQNKNKIAVRAISSYSAFDIKNQVSANQQQFNFLALHKLEHEVCLNLSIHNSIHAAKNFIYKKFLGVINRSDLDLFDDRLNKLVQKTKSDLKQFTKLSKSSFNFNQLVDYRQSIGNFDLNQFDIIASDQKMGSGKTRDVAKKLIDHVRNNFGYALVVLHLRSLCGDVASALDTEHYEKAKAFNNKLLTTCAPSLVGSNQAVRNFLSDCHDAPDLLVLDEFTQLIDFLNSKNCQPHHYYKICKLIKHASKIYIADANLSDYYYQFLLTIRGSSSSNSVLISTDESSYKEKFNKTVNFNPDSSFLDVCSHISAGLTARKKIFCVCDTKSQADNLYNYLLKLSKISISFNKILLLTRDTKNQNQAFFSQPDAYSRQFQIVICSPVVVSGVSIVNNHFDQIVAVSSSYLPAGDHVQQIARVRAVTDIYSFIVRRRSSDIVSVDNYRSAVSCGLQLLTDRSSGLTEFDEFSIMTDAKNTVLHHHYQNYFLLLLKKSGYKIVLVDDDSIKDRSLLSMLKKMRKLEREKLLIDIYKISVTAAECEQGSLLNILEPESVELYLKSLKIKCSNSLGINADKLSLYDVQFWNFGDSMRKLSNYLLISTNKTYAANSYIQNLTKMPRSALIKKIFKNIFGNFSNETVLDDKYASKIIKKIQTGCYRPVLAMLGFLDKSNINTNIKLLHDMTMVDNFEVKNQKQFVKNLLSRFGFSFVRTKNKNLGDHLYVVDLEAEQQMNYYVDCRITANNFIDDSDQPVDYQLPDDHTVDGWLYVLRSGRFCISRRDNDPVLLDQIRKLSRKDQAQLLDIHQSYIQTSLYNPYHCDELINIYEQTIEFKESYNLDIELMEAERINRYKKRRYK